MQHNIEIVGDGRFEGYKQPVKEAARLALEYMEAAPAHLIIHLVPQPYITHLNTTLRKKETATNVLSFPVTRDFLMPPSEYEYRGEIYISPAFIKEHKQDIGHMVVHGILHLYGYDHETERERIIMEREEEKILGEMKRKNV